MYTSNLPPPASINTDPVGTYYDEYYSEQLSFPAEQLDAVIGFFQKRGFDILASQSTAILLLRQARLDNVDVFKIIDTLSGLSESQLSSIVAQVLNYSRESISVLGFRHNTLGDELERRNILI